MNRLEEMNLSVIHALMIGGNDMIKMFFTGNTLKEALAALINDGSAEEVLDYAPCYALNDFRETMLCMSRFDDGFVYIEKIDDEERLYELMDVYFEDSRKALESAETLKGFLSDYNETCLCLESIRSEEKETMLEECRKKADTVWICNVKFNEKEQAEYALHQIGGKLADESLAELLKNTVEIIDTDEDFILARLYGSEEEKKRLRAEREKAEKAINELMKENFPLDYHPRRLVFIKEENHKDYGKEIKIITVNEGNRTAVRSEPWFTVVEAQKTSQCIQEYLSEGWRIVQAFPDYSPAIQQEGSYSFYKGGFTFLLERDL